MKMKFVKNGVKGFLGCGFERDVRRFANVSDIAHVRDLTVEIVDGLI